MWFWLLKWMLLGPVVRWFTRPRVVGRIPGHGPVVLAANHLAEIDSFVLTLVSPRRLTYIAKREYFEPATLRGRLDRWLCTVTGQIPVDRSGGDAGQRALDAAEQILRAGGVWAIYPEGTRSPDGRLHRGHTGAMRVAARVPGCVVVPVGIVGTAEVDRGRRWRRGRVIVSIGAPITPSGTPREATDALMAEIGRLSGQEYVDAYGRSAA